MLAPLVLPLAVFGFAVGFIGRVATTWQELTQGGLGLDILGAAAAPLIGLLGSNSQSYGPGWADATVAALAAVPDAIAAASVPTPPAAVGAGGSTATPPAADPRDAVTLLLAAAAQVGAGVAAVTPGPALVATTQAIILADAVAAASDIAYTSQQDAIQWRDRIVAALDTSVALTANLAAADPANAAPSWRALSAVRTAFLVDINGEIGRLPPVVTIQIPNTVPAWLVAQFWADGVPGEVRTAYLDIVARNRVRNPALVPAGAIEVLA